MAADQEVHDSDRAMTPTLLWCLQHPVRREILRVLGRPGVALCPSEMSTESIDFDLTRVSFHTRMLAERSVIRCVDERQSKGGTVRIYASSVSGNELLVAILRETEADDAYLRRH